MMSDSCVVVGRYLYRGDAEVAVAALASADIPASIVAQDEGGLSPGFYRDHRVCVVVFHQLASDAADVIGESLLLDSIRVPAAIREAIACHSQWALPNEGCGLLAGRNDRVELVYCLSNRELAPDRYMVDPRQHFGALCNAEARGLTIMGAWHSHPDGVAMMSRRDVEQSPGGGWITAIYGMRGGDALRAFRTEFGRSVEVKTELEPGR